MNETQLWYSDICDKTNNIKIKSKRINSRSHKHKDKFGVVVIEFQFIKPVFDELDDILNDTIKDCRKKFFIHSNLGVYMISNS